MIIVPLKQVANQNLTITLNNQVCTISLRQLGDYLFASLSVAGVALLTNMMCLNRVLLVRQAYLGFTGDLVVVDLQGQTDPGALAYQQLYTPGGSGRYALVYLAPGDY